MPTAPKNSSWASSRRLSAAKAHEFSLLSSWHLGYRNREDITMLPPGVLVQGSQNVLTNTATRIGIRKGYTLDGQIDNTIAPIVSAFDWHRHVGDTRHLRSGNGNLQVRYVANAGDSYLGMTFTAGQVYWLNLRFNQLTNNYNYASWWDPSQLVTRLLMVNGEPNIVDWSGGITTMLSVTSNTITKTGTTTWQEEGFYTTGTRVVQMNGNSFSYTGGENTTTLTGVSPSPIGTTIQSVVLQGINIVPNNTMTGLLLLNNDLIGVSRNQVYVGSLRNNNVFVSQQSDYTNYSFTTPVRLPGEGALFLLDGPPVAFIEQENNMYISNGKDLWKETLFTQSTASITAAGVTVAQVYETLDVIPLKTSSKQAAKSQDMVTKDKNDVVFISNEPVLTTLGRVSGVITTPQMNDVSFPIVNEFNYYDFTDASVFYFKNFLYVAIPKHSTVRIYNQTNPKDTYWEAPQILPISRFSVIDGELYGHSYQTPETFKLFVGYNDMGAPIDARAVFSYNNYGTRSATKSFNEFYYEGYITANTVLTLGLQYDIDGCSTSTSFTISGNDRQIVCIGGDDVSLGKVSLGKNPLGGGPDLNVITPLPPKFRGIRTFPRIPFYEEQTSFSSYGVDTQWELIAFGPAVTPTSEGNNDITQ